MAESFTVSPVTLVRIVEACDRLLEEDGWLADRPDEWRDEVQELRNHLAAELQNGRV
jgi:hypothetical protein